MHNKVIYFVAVLYISMAIISGARVKRLVGGSSVECDTRGEVLKLKHKGQFICTAILLSQTYAFTAAQCIAEDGDGYTLELQQDCSEGKPNITVSEITVHEQYDKKTNVHNIAALKFDSITLDDSIAIPTLALQVPNTGTLCTFYGYGNTSRIRFNVVIPEHLQGVDVRIITYSTCNQTFNGNLDFTGKNGLFCANGFFTSAASGDNGGPLLCNNELVGIGILAKGGQISHDVFTSIPYHSEWIQKFIN